MPANQSTLTSQHCGATCDVCALRQQRTCRQVRECHKCWKERCMPKCALLFSLTAPAHTVHKNSKVDHAQDINVQTLKPSVLRKYHRRHKKCTCICAFFFYERKLYMYKHSNIPIRKVNKDRTHEKRKMTGTSKKYCPQKYSSHTPQTYSTYSRKETSQRR